ncbi:MAG: flagellar filament capping protein FliD [Bacillota bacterium]
MGEVRLSGLISGMDTDDVISKLMAIERKPVDLLQSQKAQLQSKREAWNRVYSALTTLDAKLAGLTTVDTYLSAKASVDDSSVVQVSASSSASPGKLALEVMQLATAHVVASAAQSSTTQAIGIAGSPMINGKALLISSSDSLETIAAKINSLDAGVSATVVKVDSSSWKLVVSSKQTGAAAQITLVDDGGALEALGLVVNGQANTVQEAQDARFKVNSIEVQRASNTVSDVVTGLTFTLKNIGTTVVTVERDYSAVVSAVKAFVNAYNSAVDAIKNETYYDATNKKAGALLGETSLMSLQNKMRQVLVSAVPGLPQSLSRAADVGLTTEAYVPGSGSGEHLKLDEGKLTAALESDPEAVMKLFGARRVNVALASSGASATGLDEYGNTNEYDAQVYSASGAINGDTSSLRWGTTGGGWNDGTAGVYPDYLQIVFAGQRTIDTVKVYTLNSEAFPANQYGVRDLRVQYWDGTTWITVSTVSGNTSGVVSCSFDPVTTDRIRVVVDATNGQGDYSRITEVEVYQRDAGLASAISELLKSFTSSGGVIKNKQDTIDRTVSNIDSRIEDWERRLELREEALRKQFNSMEVALNKLKTQSAWLSIQFASIYGSGEKS